MAENKRQSNGKVFQLISHFEDLCLFKKPVIKRNPFTKRRQVVSEYSEEPSTPSYLKGAKSVDCFSDVFSIEDVPAKSIEYLEQQFLADDVVSDDETVQSDGLASDNVEEYRRRAKEEEERYRQSFMSEFSDFDVSSEDEEIVTKTVMNAAHGNVPVYDAQELLKENIEEELYEIMNYVDDNLNTQNACSSSSNEPLYAEIAPKSDIPEYSHQGHSVPEGGHYMDMLYFTHRPINQTTKVSNDIPEYAHQGQNDPESSHYLDMSQFMHKTINQSPTVLNDIAPEYGHQGQGVTESSHHLDMSQLMHKPINQPQSVSNDTPEYAHQGRSDPETNQYLDILHKPVITGVYKKSSFSSNVETNEETEPKLTVKKNKKQHIVDELIESELKYLEQLSWLTKNYMMPLLRRNCTRSDTDVIFTNIRDIYEASQMFVMNLQECQYNYVEVGKVFCKHRELFEKYPKYCKNRRKAYQLITVKYKEIIKALQIRLDDKLGLNSSLLKPVQRLAKYELLLINLSNDLIQDGAPCQSIQNAITMIQNVARVSDIMVTLETIKKNPFNYKSLGDFLLKDKFKLLQPEKQEIVIFLFKRMIIFTEEIQDIQEEFRYKTYIPLKKLRHSSSTHYGTLSFSLEYYDKKKKNSTYVLEASDEKLKSKWIEEIGKILWSQLEKAKEQQMNSLIKKLQENAEEDTISVANNENSDVETETSSYEHLFQANDDTLNPEESSKKREAEESQTDKSTKKRSFRKKEKPKVKNNKSSNKPYALKSIAQVYSQWPHVH